MPEFAKHDQENDGGRDPGVEFVDVYDFVAEDGHYPGCCCDNYDASVAGNVGVHGVDELSADYDIDG